MALSVRAGRAGVRVGSLFMTAVPEPHFIHHLGVFASDFTASERFYTAALAPLNIQPGYRTHSIAEYWVTGIDTPSLSLEAAPTTGEVTRGLHVGFEAADRAAVDAFYAAAMMAGGSERESPKYWSEYGAYAAFVSDPDGNNVEALVKESRKS